VNPQVIDNPSPSLYPRKVAPQILPLQEQRAQQWKEKDEPTAIGAERNALGQAPFQHTAGSRDQMQRPRAVFGAPSRATAAAPGSKKGKPAAKTLGK
jgi:hypothetical protein